MKLIYHKSKFPTIYLNVLNEIDEEDKYYNKFMFFLEKLYKKEKYFHFIIDIDLYCMTSIGIFTNTTLNRLCTLDDSPVQYLTYIILIIQSSLLTPIISRIVKLTKKLDIYIVSNKTIANELTSYLNNHHTTNELLNLYILCNNITKV